ncbi:SDR family NAD(P)-dependent oxidoreductase [Glutamicibacter sp. MNS18]|uniref:SDR family NAD(P)-dependent oxidoreductase n=1 Tax=Glutamicibacter sp. MNS18 TaxID=2989817 RepID=UPI002236A6D4|nr:SDR family NAD(P)-dependent oxidoreductase [Glutamicibacter sp. MNS18]MCW4464266.1 SDR family NAD(P)-dependent oxidoreductase [Glutamicibacter sp. MNS18]
MSEGSSTTRIWFITGAGRGLGRAFAQAALDHGDRVVGTVRQPGALADLQAGHPDSVREILLDVRDATAVAAAVDEAARAFGGIDIVVNNAGGGLVGAIEEVDEQQARAHLDLNLFGALWVCRAAIPHLRARGGGDIVQISTVGAIGAMPTFGLYNAGKWALEGFSEALSAEVAPFGIHVTIAQLGGFATDWAGSSMSFATPKPEYDDLRTALFGTAQIPWPAAEPGEASTDADPRTAADALVAHLSNPGRPLRVLIGDDAREHAALAYTARRDSYGADRDFNWPS